MTDNDRSRWRDEERLPLQDLDRAIARSANEGEVDDATGGEVGPESAFGHDAEPAQPTAPSERDAMTDPERAHRPSTTGRTGPS